MNETRLLAESICVLRYDDLPQEIVSKCKDLILDQFGAELASSNNRWSRMIFDYVRDFEGPPESTVVKYGFKTKAENAAFANACFGHALEIDDLHSQAPTHPGCVVVPAALAMAERQKASGKDLILAVVSGYEVMIRTMRAVSPSAGGRGFHMITGPFGAAVAAGKLLQFDPHTMAMAISIAGSHAGGLREYDQSGGDVKRAHAGMAAHGGVRAAMLAQRGLTGPTTILEGIHGFCHAFADEYHLEYIAEGFGKEFIGVTGTSYKIHGCCAATHVAIDSLQRLLMEHDIKPQDIAEVVVQTNRATIGHVGTICNPKDVLSAQFSMPFSLALTCVKRDNSIDAYTESSLQDVEIMDLAQRVKLLSDSQLNGAVLGAAQVVVKLRDGTEYQASGKYAKGTPQVPLTAAELEAKFRRSASGILPESRIKEIIQIVGDLDRRNDLSVLIDALTQV
jgi:2-methylcitrate dehydratase PrpD